MSRLFVRDGWLYCAIFIQEGSICYKINNLLTGFQKSTAKLDKYVYNLSGSEITSFTSFTVFYETLLSYNLYSAFRRTIIGLRNTVKCLHQNVGVLLTSILRIFVVWYWLLRDLNGWVYIKKKGTITSVNNSAFSFTDASQLKQCSPLLVH